MEICKTPPERLEEVMALYARARKFMRRTGNPDQWGQDYPGEDLIAREIARGQSHLCLDGREIAAVFSLIEGEDPTYRTICDGAWLNDAPYGTVHRICAAQPGAGTGAFCLDWCAARCGNLRIDTHRCNRPMQALLRRCGFTYCGRIFLEDGAERLAFQKTL